MSKSSNWWRGNLHTHTMWSDGNDFPESAAKWYKEHGYNFVLLADHNVVLKGEYWRSMPKDHPALARSRELFGDKWAQTRPGDDGKISVRLRTLDELRRMFDEPQRFLLVQGMEADYNENGTHWNTFYDDPRFAEIPAGDPARVEKVHAIIRKDMLNHPNLGWAATAEQMANWDFRFFEVYNSFDPPGNHGDAHHPNTDRMWDIALALRLSNGNGKILFGTATDDTHNYFSAGAAPGCGWVMVNAPELTQQAIFDALNRGDFYASTGVTLHKIAQVDNTISVEIEPKQNVEYVTEYIGTRRGFDPASSPSLDENGKEAPNITRKYNRQIGEVLFRTIDHSSNYKFAGDELYVRVRVTSTADHCDPVTGTSLGDRQCAWGQPMVPAKQWR